MQRLRPSPFLVLFLTLAAGTGRAQQMPPCAPLDAQAPANAPDATAAPVAAGADDSRRAGFDISSDRATVAVDGNAVLSGNVEVRQGAREIRAGEVQYDARTRSLKSATPIEYTDPVVHVSGEGGSYSPDSGAEFRSAQFELRQRGARGAARTLELTPEGVLHLGGVTFTTCPAHSSAWELRARDITLDTQSRIGSGHGASVEFGGVPLLWLPWVSFPLGAERKSGFLFPTIGNNSRSGAQLSVPWYWNIAPNADFTFQPVEYSRRGPDVGGDLRFLTHQQRGELEWNYLPFDDVFHGTRSRVRLVDRIDFPENLRVAVAAENVSDTQYFQDFAQGPEGTSTAFVERRGTLSYRDEHWRVDAEAQHWQTVDPTLPQGDRPYARVPRIAATGAFSAGPEQLLHYGIDAELVDFQRSNRGLYPAGPGLANPCTQGELVTLLCTATGWRLDAMPTLALAFDQPGFFAHPTLAWRYTRYALDHMPQGFDRNPSRSLPIASFDTGLVFERPGGTGGDRTVTLEPRAMYLYVPYRRQDNLPVFDTAAPDLNPVELFRMNRYVGADRVGDADQLSLGVTSRLLDAGTGRQFMAATIGEAFYFRTPRVILPGETIRSDRRSDFVAQLAVSAFESWAADLGLQWNPQAGNSDRVYVNLQYRPSPAQVINVGYRFQRDLLPLRPNCVPLQAGSPPPPNTTCSSGVEQVEVSGAWPVARTWNVFAREVYSLKDEKVLESFAGFEYRSCCWGVRFGGRRFVSTRSGNQDTGVFLELELIGLASVGSASNAVLMENIRGYVPADARAGP